MTTTPHEVSSIPPAPLRPAGKRWEFCIPLAILIAIFSYLVIFHYHHERKDNGTHLGDFPTFYQAAQFAKQHRDIYTAGRPPKQMYVYPPLIAFLYTPLTALPIVQAAHVSLLLNTLMLIGALFLAAKAIAQRLDPQGAVPIVAVAALVSILDVNEMRNVLTMLETDAIMLLMFTLALYWLDRRPVLAGIALAFAFNIKYLTIVTLPYLILRRRWKTVAAMVAGSVFFALLPAVMLGWQEDLRCLHIAFGGLLKWVHAAPADGFTVEVHNIGDTLSLSVTSAIARILSPYGASNLVIMAVAGAIGLVALAIVTLMFKVNGFCLWQSREGDVKAKELFAGLTALEWAGLVTVALVFSPDTNTRHLLLAVIVNTTAVVMVLMRRPAVSRIPALIGLGIILMSLVMPIPALRTQFFWYGIPAWGLLCGYLLILWTGLQQLNAERELRRFH